VSAPWVPVFALVDGRWKVIAEAANQALPVGVGGQPWDAGPIVVGRSRRVVGVFSADSGDNTQELLQLAERALDRVAAVRPSGWSGRVVVTAVRDRNVFDRARTASRRWRR
jgi:hypothetical protein